MSSDPVAGHAYPALTVRQRIGTGDWHAVLRRYLVVIALGNFVWEMFHMPLYTIWREGTWNEIAFAALHCTGGDILIALSSLILALLLAGNCRSEEHTSELQSLMRISYAVFCLKKKISHIHTHT